MGGIDPRVWCPGDASVHHLQRVPTLYHAARLDPFAEILLPGDEIARKDAIERERRAAAHRVNAAPRIAHVNAVHPNVADSEGMVTLMRATQQPDGSFRWESRVVPVAILADSDDLLWATHLSMQRHRGARGRSAVAQVQALIADVECQATMFRGMDHAEMAGVMLARLDSAGLPRPSYILCSGRGLHIVFLHEARNATKEFMRRWRAVMKGFHGPKNGKPRLTVKTSCGTRMADPEAIAHEAIAHEAKMASVWRGTDLDRGVCDTARVLRLAGTWNPKSQTSARLVWPASWADVERHDFETLAAAFLPWTRAQLQALRDERHAEYLIREADRQARGITGDEEAEAPVRRRRTDSYWGDVVAALEAVRQWWGGSPPEGLRDWWAFLSACAMAQHEGGTAASWAARLHGPAGLPEEELRVALGALDAALRRHEAGEILDRDGVERTTVYSYSKERMLALLGLSEEQAREAGADVLLPGGVRRDERQRSRERRQAAGAEARPLTVAARLADGYEAAAMRDAGRTMAEIVRAFAGRRGETSLRRAMAEADAASPRTVFEIADDRREEGSISGPHDSTTTIVAKPAPLGAPRLPTATFDPVPAFASPPDGPIAPTGLQAAPHSPSRTQGDIDTAPAIAPVPRAVPVPPARSVATVDRLLRDAVSAVPAQGAPYSPDTPRMSHHTGHLAEPPSSASPGHGPGGPNDLALPAFLVDLTGVRWISQLPVSPCGNALAGV